MRTGFILKKKFIVIFIAIIIIASLGGFFLLKAQSPNIFGGFVINSFFCNCSNNFLLTIGPPVGGQFIYQFTPQYPFFRLPSSGVWTLGLYNPGGTCLVWVGKSCAPVGFPLGTITPIVGTSN